MHQAMGRWQAPGPASLPTAPGRPTRAGRAALWWRLAGLLTLLLLLAGCATPQLAHLQKTAPDLPPVAEVRAVPFFPQEEYQCGPASLAMVAQHAGRSVTPEALRAQVYLPDRQGSLQIEMLAAARRQGLVALVIEPELSALLRQVSAGRPVVVLQNLSLPWAPLWHYAVVIGYDLGAQSITLHSGLNERLSMPLSTFERTWARGRHWAMLALAPEQMPQGLQPQSWLQASAALERVHGQAASAAYVSATRAWPEDPMPWLGLGNTRYAQGEREAAAQAYEQATRLAPGFADAWNNLAQVRLEQQRWEEAAQAVERAVTLGGPRLERYRALQRQVLSRRPEGSRS